jgi:hypothetical protein
MKLKSAILSVLGREDLKRVVDDLGLDGVDRHSVNAMWTAIAGSRRVGGEGLLGYLRKDGLVQRNPRLAQQATVGIPEPTETMSFGFRSVTFVHRARSNTHISSARSCSSKRQTRSA